MYVNMYVNTSNTQWSWDRVLVINHCTTLALVPLVNSILAIVLTKAAPALVIKWSGEYFLK